MVDDTISAIFAKKNRCFSKASWHLYNHLLAHDLPSILPKFLFSTKRDVTLSKEGNLKKYKMNTHFPQNFSICCKKKGNSAIFEIQNARKPLIFNSTNDIYQGAQTELIVSTKGEGGV